MRRVNEQMLASLNVEETSAGIFSFGRWPMDVERAAVLLALDLRDERALNAELVAALMVAQVEMVTLFARLSDPYARNVRAALDRIEAALAKAESAK